uniref:Phosphoribosyl-AMP cyclohydrolase n=1 Tax=Alexandrium andersonii TaxID=327968 RepID=A0A7S2E1P7_9DINO|mmetsp:Transcript_63172/g.142059  ORF Transcript_63172/g.142059 Transcript_63172/m.142059 type:complete len:196 (+) Transcript_63172:80-667(+)
MRSSRLACAAVVLMALVALDSTSLGLIGETGVTKFGSRIKEEEVYAAQKGWGDALVQIATTYDELGYDAAKALAEEVIDAAYGYNYGPVLFKPTMSSGDQVYRITKEGALSYFAGRNSNYPRDGGFALKGWRKVVIENSAVFIQGDIAVATGNFICTDKNGVVTTLDKTMVFYKGKDRKLRIMAHHSSLPYVPGK